MSTTNNKQNNQDQNNSHNKETQDNIISTSQNDDFAKALLEAIGPIENQYFEIESKKDFSTQNLVSKELDVDPKEIEKKASEVQSQITLDLEILKEQEKYYTPQITNIEEISSAIQPDDNLSFYNKNIQRDDNKINYKIGSGKINSSVISEVYNEELIDDDIIIDIEPSDSTETFTSYDESFLEDESFESLEAVILNPIIEENILDEEEIKFPKDERFSGEKLTPPDAIILTNDENKGSSFRKILSEYDPEKKEVHSRSINKNIRLKEEQIKKNRKSAHNYLEKHPPKAVVDKTDPHWIDDGQGKDIKEVDKKIPLQEVKAPAYKLNNKLFKKRSNLIQEIERDAGLAEIAQVASQKRLEDKEIFDPEVNYEAIRQSYSDERKQRRANIKAYRRNPTLFILKQIIKPLSLINPFLSVFVGASIARISLPSSWNLEVLIASLVTCFFVQVFANLCKEYSMEELTTRYECSLVDHKFANRYTIFKYTIFALILSCISGITLIYFADLNLGTTLVFAGLGIITITILLRYSIGDEPYSFSILGEFSYLFVYGLLMVGASFYLQVHKYENIIIAPAIASGFCAVASLNLINMRDSYVSAVYLKENFATFLGPKAGRVLQTVLYLSALGLYTYFNYVLQFPPYCYAFLISVPLIIIHLIIVHKDVKSSTLNLQKYMTSLINICMTGSFAFTTSLFFSQVSYV